MPLAAASSDLKVQIILLMVALAGYGLAWLILERSRRRAAANAHTDAESGAMHGLAFDEEITREIARSRRTGEHLCLALVEVGALANGDEPDRDDLRQMASAWRGELRLTDVVGRVGENRFGVLLPLCGRVNGQHVVDRLRQAAPADYPYNAAVVALDEGDRTDTLMRRAERALALAKRTGVERTFVPTEDDEAPVSAPGPLPA
jgi:GGDEF domain-containing protein